MKLGLVKSVIISATILLITHSSSSPSKFLPISFTAANALALFRAYSLFITFLVVDGVVDRVVDFVSDFVIDFSFTRKFMLVVVDFVVDFSFESLYLSLRFCF